MSLSSTFNSALSGLLANARAASVVSSNIANAATDGYGRRDLELATRAQGPLGNGVRVVAERRLVDAALLADRRTGDAATGDARARAAALSSIEGAFGVPGAPGALTTRLAEFEAALTEAISRPDSYPRQENALRAAAGLADGIAALSREVQAARGDADRQVAAKVDQMNATLVQIDDLNRSIQREVLSGRDANGLIDQRQQLVDSIAGIVPLREVARPHGQIALYTDTGAVLLDGRPADIGFTPAPADPEPGMTLANGALSGLTFNGRAIGTGEGSLLSGGSLGAAFAVRDRLMPDAQAGLDAFAADLLTRFETADAASPAPSGLGLFTDAGAVYDPAALTGLSARLQLNPAVDPEQGGAVWRLRDGLGAALPGPPGAPAGLLALQDALALRAPPVAGPSVPARDLSGLAADLQSRLGGLRSAADGRLGYVAARTEALRDALAREGVDTDAELQTLLLVESLYAANARVLQAADEMLRTLIQI